MTFEWPQCELCHEDIDPRDDGVYRYIEGWVQNRGAGGAHAVFREKNLGRYAHRMCMDLDKKGLLNQQSIF